MENLDEIKKLWKTECAATRPKLPADWLERIKQRAGRAVSTGMQFFWASFIYQLIVYALLVHIIVRYRQDTQMVLVSFACLLLYIPFMIRLLKNYKRLAVWSSQKGDTGNISMRDYVLRQHNLLSEFFRFKKRYEMVLVPLTSACLVWIIFRLYFPGGVSSHLATAAFLYVLVVAACAAAIYSENRRNFKKPLREFSCLLQDLNQDLEHDSIT